MVPPILSFDPSGMNMMAASEEKINKEGGGGVKEGKVEEDVEVCKFIVPW
jgi:hypothetical protein